MWKLTPPSAGSDGKQTAGMRLNRLGSVGILATFVTGLLGINVGGIPGSENGQGFVVACVLLAGIAAFQWWLFRRLRWL